MCDLVVARTSASIRGRGTIRQGAVFCADDPVVLNHGSVFQPLSLSHFCGDAEQMTAAPGEKRNVQLPNGDAKAIREWAAANDIEVSGRGKLPAEVVEAYREAHRE